MMLWYCGTGKRGCPTTTSWNRRCCRNYWTTERKIKKKLRKNKTNKATIRSGHQGRKERHNKLKEKNYILCCFQIYYCVVFMDPSPTVRMRIRTTASSITRICIVAKTEEMQGRNDIEFCIWAFIFIIYHPRKNFYIFICIMYIYIVCRYRYRYLRSPHLIRWVWWWISWHKS